MIVISVISNGNVCRLSDLMISTLVNFVKNGYVTSFIFISFGIANVNWD